MNRRLLAAMSVLVMAVVLVFGITALLVMAAPAASAAAPIYVDDDTCPSTGSGTQGDPYCRIQDAVDAASGGDEVRVAAGTYDGPQTLLDGRTGYTYTQVVFIDKDLTLRGGYDSSDWRADPQPSAHPTIIRAERKGRCVSIVGTWGAPISVTVDGFTVTGGDYTGLGNPTGAGNQVCRSPAGYDCGGGLYASRASLLLRNTVVTDNIASRNLGQGGGIYLWGVPAASRGGGRIEHTVVVSNSADLGGGMSVTEVYYPFTITDTVFRDNLAILGGGLCLKSNIEAPVTIAETDFHSNLAQGDGGGARITLAGEGEILRMDRVRLSDNQAGGQGAALYLRKVGSRPTRARMSNLLMTGNSRWRSQQRPFLPGDSPAAVIAIARGHPFDVRMAHLTAADNAAPTVLRAEGPDAGEFLTVALTNTLIVSATHGFVASQNVGDGSVLVRHSHTLAQDVMTLHHVEAGAPALEAVSPLDGDAQLDSSYHLQPGSDAIDAGVDAGVVFDMDGDSRLEHAPPDIGADEFRRYRIYLPVVQRGQ